MGAKPLDRLVKVFQVNRQQTAFASYAAELSFYLILAMIPILLAFANVLAILPVESQGILKALESAIPDQVQAILLPMVSSYLDNTSTSAFSLGLLISLWPASQVFNTIQRIFNTIYKAKPRANFILTRGLAYVFTLFIVVVVFIISFFFMFGEFILDFLNQHLLINLTWLAQLAHQGGVFAGLVLFVMLVLLYKYLPNVNQSFRAAVPGALFCLLGFHLVFQIFGIYAAFFSKSINSNSAIGVVIVVLLWLYLNTMVLTMGAYVNVIYHDYRTMSYPQLVEAALTFKTWSHQSADYREELKAQPFLTGTLTKELPESTDEE